MIAIITKTNHGLMKLPITEKSIKVHNLIFHSYIKVSTSPLPTLIAGRLIYKSCLHFIPLIVSLQTISTENLETYLFWFSAQVVPFQAKPRIQVGREPVDCTCPNCNTNIKTVTEKNIGMMAWTASGVICFAGL